MSEAATTTQTLPSGRRISIEVRDLTCIAQLMQSAITQGGNPYAACDDCPYCCHIRDEYGQVTHRSPRAEFLIWRLAKVTGTRVSPVVGLECVQNWMRQYDKRIAQKQDKQFVTQEVKDEYYGTEEQQAEYQEKVKAYLERGY